MVPPVTPYPRGLLIQVGPVCDTLLAQRKVIREAYERYGGNLNNFQRLAQVLKLCDRSFTAKHVCSIYSLARRPQVVEDDKHCTGLKDDEFCEAVARLALIWQKGSTGAVPTGKREWPPQPHVDHPVRQRAIAARLRAFLAKMADGMRPNAKPIAF